MPDYKIINLSSLVPYVRNSRTHSPAQIDKIAASIREFGFLAPVIVRGDGTIIAGHGRVLAAQKLGLSTVPAIDASHLTDAQMRAYVIADNRIATESGWDMDLLRVEIDDLQSAGFDVSLTGFDISEIASMSLDAEPDALDAVDDIKTECVVQIVCADYGEREMAIARLGGKKISWDDLEVMLR